MMGKLTLVRFLPAALMALVAVPSQAADISPVLFAGFDTGGEKLVTVTFTNGKTDSIRANEGLYIGGGASLLNEAKNVEFQATIGIKYSSITASNGDVTFTRYPLDLLVFYRMEKFRVGGGLTYVMSPKVSSSGIPGSANVTLDNATGVVVQADFLFGKASIGLRYTALDYKVFGNTVDSSGVGILAGVRF